MKNTLLYVSIVFLPILSAGCFEIREEVNMKADGSGEASFILNLSPSKDNMGKYMTMESVEGVKVPKKETVEAGIERIKNLLSQSPGISGVLTKSDWTNYLFTVSCRFAHLEALNKAMIKLSKEWNKDGKSAIEYDNFSYNNTQFRRIFDYPVKPEAYQKLTSLQRYALESAKMISIYRFEKSIRHYSNRKAQLSPSGKALMLQLPIADLAKGTASLDNIITF
jgi:hypothetical protein